MSIEKAAGMLGQLAAELGASTQQLRDQAREIVEDELLERHELDRFEELLRLR